MTQHLVDIVVLYISQLGIRLGSSLFPAYVILPLPKNKRLPFSCVAVWNAELLISLALSTHVVKALSRVIVAGWDQRRCIKASMSHDIPSRAHAIIAFLGVEIGQGARIKVLACTFIGVGGVRLRD